MKYAATRFAIESESLILDGGANSLEFERCMGHLLEVWEFFGILVEDTADSFVHFSGRDEFLSRMSIKFRHKFQRQVLSRFGRRNFRRETSTRPISWDAITTLELLDGYADDFELAFMQSKRAYQLGLQSGGNDLRNGHDYCTNCNSVSVSLWSLAKDTCKFRNRPTVIRQRTGMAYRKEKIGTLAGRCSETVIVDRYAIDNMFGSDGAYIEDSGLVRLLRFLDELGSIWHITVYGLRGKYKPKDSERFEDLPVEWIRDSLQSEINSLNNIVEIEVNLPRHTTFKNEAHGRHMRFDENKACTIDIGPSAFMDSALRQAHFLPLFGDDLRMPTDEGEISLKEIEENLACSVTDPYRFTLSPK